MQSAMKTSPLRTDPTPQHGRRVLFVCTGNTCRSPMAAALFNEMMRYPRELCSACAEEREDFAATATSAGLYAVPGAPISAHAVAALREAGVIPTSGNDYEAHRARNVSAELMEQADEVIAISAAHAMELTLRFPEHADKIRTLPMDVPDPYGGDLTAYRACLHCLRYCLELYGGEETQ